MFPSELEIKMHNQEMQRQAANERLVQIARGEDEKPSLWARLTERMSAAEPEIKPAVVPHKKTVTA